MIHDEETALLKQDEKRRSFGLFDAKEGFGKILIYLPVVIMVVANTLQSEIIQNLERGDLAKGVQSYQKPLFIVWANHCSLCVFALSPRNGASYSTLMKDGFLLAFLDWLPNGFFLTALVQLPVSIAQALISCTFMCVIPIRYYMFGFIPVGSQWVALVIGLSGLLFYLFGTVLPPADHQFWFGVGCCGGYALVFAIFLCMLGKLQSRKERPYRNYTFPLAGWIGIMNIFLSPILVVAHFTGYETFELPPSGAYGLFFSEWLCSLVINFSIIVGSKLVGPAVMGFGHAMLIPAGIIPDWFYRHYHPSKYDFIGAVLLCSAVILWELYETHDIEEEENEEGKKEFDNEIGDIVDVSKTPSRSF